MILVFEEKPKYSRNHGENTIFSQEVQGTRKKIYYNTYYALPSFKQ